MLTSMILHSDPSGYNQLEFLFREFCNLDTPSFPRNEVLFDKLNVTIMDENTISFDIILDSVVKYTENEDWKHRVFGLFLLMFIVKHDQSLHNWFNFSKVKDKRTILTHFWRLVTDPNPRVQTHVTASDPELTRTLIDWTWWQVTDYGPEKIGYDSNLDSLFDDFNNKILQIPLHLSAEQYQRIDFESLTKTLPPPDAARQAAYFWRTITLLLSRINETSSIQINRQIHQLIETSLCGYSYHFNDTFPRVITIRPSSPYQKDAVSKFPPIWKTIFRNIVLNRSIICFLFCGGFFPPWNPTILFFTSFLMHIRIL